MKLNCSLLYYTDNDVYIRETTLMRSSAMDMRTKVVLQDCAGVEDHVQEERKG